MHPSNHPKVFISYAREDANAASRLYNDLKVNGALPWYDKEDLLPGDNWDRSITLAIENCDFFIAILSSKSIGKKGYVQRELKKALSILDDFPEGAKYLIPARIEECHPSQLRLRDIHWVDLFPSWEKGLERILLTLEARPLSSPAPTVKGEKKQTKRLELNLSPEAVERLDALTKEEGARSNAEVLRRSLQLYEFLINEKSRGNEILLNREGKEIELVFPSS